MIFINIVVHRQTTDMFRRVHVRAHIQTQTCCACWRPRCCCSCGVAAASIARSAADCHASTDKERRGEMLGRNFGQTRKVAQKPEGNTIDLYFFEQRTRARIYHERLIIALIQECQSPHDFMIYTHISQKYTHPTDRSNATQTRSPV
jgi:hypothetical protein